ncbi:tetratricopeptide repeat protein [Cytobacillus gottheilii]|uniref:tetratricopeptide repeat protein n=1 Tax=Cytobacillus gottheilii TaxID=859144 RepID=UPI0009BAB603|nr:tetratricopeptide repeat protein [Cytobacillus gottheilii]
MKKREQKNSNDNIILFPGLEQRLIEKGLEAVKQKDFKHAVRYLEEAILLDPENSEIHIGLVLAYFESGNLQKSKRLAENMLQADIGNYIDIMDLYLMILVQLGHYAEIITAIEGLLEEKEVPSEKYEHFSTLLAFSRKQIQSAPIEIEEEQETFSELEHINFFALHDQNEQIQIAAKLAQSNIQNHLQGIEEYLKDENGQYFFKTILLNVLAEHGIERSVLVNKGGRQQLVIPAEMLNWNDQEQYSEVIGILEAIISQEDPILYENTKEIIKRHFFLLYPFEVESISSKALAAAYHRLVTDYFGLETSSEELEALYEVEERKIQAASEYISALEEIS